MDQLIFIFSFLISYLLVGRGHFTKKWTGEYYRHPEWIDAFGFTIGLGLFIFGMISVLLGRFG